jgi:hypothetical protein
MRYQHHFSRLAFGFLLAVAALATACGVNSAVSPNIPTANGTPANGAPSSTASEPVYSAAVTFDGTVPYDTALRALADLGLQPVRICVWKNWTWQSPDYKANWGDGSELVVAATPSAPQGWLQPLGKLPGVRAIQPNPVASCPAMGFNAPPAGTRTYLPRAAAGTLARVRFAAATPYSVALDTIAELGFRLADPCYERQH